MATDSLPLVGDASFSLYLNNTYETFILKLVEMTQNTFPTINGLLESLSHYQISLGRKNTNGEISVFIAERKRLLCAKTTYSFKNPSDRITAVTMGKFQADWTCLKGARVGQGKRAKSRGDTEDLALRSTGLDKPRPDPVYLPWQSYGEPTQK
ncbi:hypothetical protein NE237_002945 [Protea cynaroides]|uniref:Uncharacterized protein n=1 Tax=Protea cynaroides TaxID=273540 RepID=A0A9Q0KGF8_9MAGN|nr:hypothetical protein NE237_002945 [Protea cynaroides]